jgi:uncharacterized protein YbjT (DUF2867 family)
MEQTYTVIMMGATGAVGNHVALLLAQSKQVAKLTLLGRRRAANIVADCVSQYEVDIFSSDSYAQLLDGHDTAVCTLGVGQPSKMSKEEFIKIDKLAVLDFAKSCKKAGVKHFQLLSSVGVSSKSASYYLRTKGELEDALKALHFERLTLFHPSMIITPTNRYGFSQWLTLKLMPLIDPLLFGSLQKFRSIQVEKLGAAIAMNVFLSPQNPLFEELEWKDFQNVAKLADASFNKIRRT